MTTKKVGSFETEKLAGFRTKVGKLGPTRGSPPPFNSKFIAGLRWWLELVGTVAGCLRLLSALFCFGKVMPPTLIQISLSPEIRLSSDNASFRFPYLFIYNLFKFGLLIYLFVP